jgi:hypothetical protein
MVDRCWLATLAGQLVDRTPELARIIDELLSQAAVAHACAVPLVPAHSLQLSRRPGVDDAGEGGLYREDAFSDAWHVAGQVTLPPGRCALPSVADPDRKPEGPPLLTFGGAALD